MLCCLYVLISPKDPFSSVRRLLLPLLPDETQPPIRDALSQLQMAFAREAQGGGEPPSDAAEPPRPPDEKDAEAAERAKARSKIWTPPGT